MRITHHSSTLNALRRAVFFNRLGEIRDRSYENQRHRASGLNLLVAAIILWNTAYLQRAVDHLRNQGHCPASGDLAHLSPVDWEHINLTGDYHWDTSPTLGPDEFRPLRTHARDFAAAAIAVGMPIAEHPPHRSRRA
jgi:Tn3 transposase DDE domain